MNALKPTLGGAVCIRNGDLLDFPWRECVRSLLPVCDEVCLCVGSGNEDDTEVHARAWAAEEPKINLCIYPWPDPKGDSDFWVKWLNYAREHLKSDWHFQLDADEILHEKSHAELREFVRTGTVKTGIVTRHNFWKDHRHTIMEGICLGKKVVRIAPAKLWLASDGYHPLGEHAASLSNWTGIEIYHYGFIRRKEAFFRKERLLQNYFFNSYDPRLEAVEKLETNWMDEPSVGDYCGKLDPYTGDHPEVIRQWLKERGME